MRHAAAEKAEEARYLREQVLFHKSKEEERQRAVAKLESELVKTKEKLAEEESHNSKLRGKYSNLCHVVSLKEAQIIDADPNVDRAFRSVDRSLYAYDISHHDISLDRFHNEVICLPSQSLKAQDKIKSSGLNSRVIKFCNGEGENYFGRYFYSNSHLENDRNVFREQEILHCLGFHKNLVIFYGVFNFESRLFSVTKQPITNLKDVLSFGMINYLAVGDIYSILSDICSGLKFIHDQDFIHNSLSVDSVYISFDLVDEPKPESPKISNPTAVIGQFGLCCREKCSKRWTANQIQCFVDEYSAPEIRQNIAPNKCADIYSLGRISWKLNFTSKYHLGNLVAEFMEPCINLRRNLRPNISDCCDILERIRITECTLKHVQLY